MGAETGVSHSSPPVDCLADSASRCAWRRSANATERNSGTFHYHSTLFGDATEARVTGRVSSTRRSGQGRSDCTLPRTRRAAIGALAGIAFSGGVITLGQNISQGFENFWGSKYAPFSATAAPQLTVPGRIVSAPSATARAEEERSSLPAPADARSRLDTWNRVAIDASGIDHIPVAPGENRTFGEQLGPGRAARAMAIYTSRSLTQ